MTALVIKLRTTAATPQKLKGLVASTAGPKKRSTAMSAQKLAQMKKFADED